MSNVRKLKDNSTGSRKSSWKQDPENVKRDILDAAMKEFAKAGLSGARIDDISAQTSTSKRMIYYYFGDKAGLYLAALEAAYQKVRAGEKALDLDGMLPLEALRQLVSFTFDHHRKNPEFIRMVMIENIHHADFLQASKLIREISSGAIERLAEVLSRGVAAGVFRPGIDPLELHWQISALSVFNVSNRHTFSAIFGNTLFEDSHQDGLRDRVAEMIVGSVKL